MKIIASNIAARYSLDRHLEISFVVDRASEAEARAAYDFLEGKRLSVEIKEYKRKRSLSANAYAWVLLGEIAKRANLDVISVYKKTIRECGCSYFVTAIAEDAVGSFEKIWEKNGIGWFCETLETVDGFTTLLVFAGSSTFDTSQMSRFIDTVVQDAKALGIETLTPDELQRMKGEWG